MLRERVRQDKGYQPSEEELESIKAWASAPNIILSEQQLQRIYEFPAGSIWDFFLDVLGVRKVPTTRERIEAGFESYLQLYNFNESQTACLRKIKNAFVANMSSLGKVDLDSIFGNPIYSRLLGSFEDANMLFDGRLRDVVGQMQETFRIAA
jgi:hypothetical protein